MAELLQTDLLTEESAFAQLDRRTAANGIRYATLGRLAAPHTSAAELARLAGAVPAGVAASLTGVTYAFVPLAFSAVRLEGDGSASPAFDRSDKTLIAPAATPALVDKATCHRNSTVQGQELVFLSAELHNDSFALAFEFFINVAHDLVDLTGTPASFATLLAEQAAAGVKGETSLDSWEHRGSAYGLPAEEPPQRNRVTARAATLARTPPASGDTAADPQKARTAYADAAFADAIAIYLLSLYLDVDYADLREREYPLLAPAALAARLRAVHALFPAGEGYRFSILYRRRP